MLRDRVLCTCGGQRVRELDHKIDLESIKTSLRGLTHTYDGDGGEVKSPSQRRTERQVRAQKKRHFLRMVVDGGECNQPVLQTTLAKKKKKIPAKQTTSLHCFFSIHNWKDLKALKLLRFSLKEYTPLVSWVDTRSSFQFFEVWSIGHLLQLHQGSL